jgi:hypothetical protein
MLARRRESCKAAIALDRRRAIHDVPAMRTHIFLSGFLVLAAGLISTRLLGKMESFEFVRGAFTLGGAFLICGLFTLRMQWHGVIGAGVVALLGAAKGVLNLKDFPAYFMGDHSRGLAPLLEIAITLICVVLLVRVVRLLQSERTRIMLAEGENQRDGG